MTPTKVPTNRKLEAEKNRPKSKPHVSVEEHLRILDRFFETHGSELERPLDSSQQEPALGNVGRMLAQAIEVNEPVVYSLVLQAWLIKHGLKPPKGVFIPDLHRGRPGRKRKADDQLLVWVTHSKMKNPTFGKVARQLFPGEHSADPKKASDRVRQLYRSFEERFPDADLREAVWEFVSSETPSPNPTSGKRGNSK